jgi:UDP-arabinose 4-epimerase
VSAPCVLVTGGAGYIGSHTAKALLAAGYEPVVVDDLSRGHRELVRFGPFEQASILDAARMRQILDRYQPVGVIHFAAFAFVEESVAEPEKYWLNNVAGSANLIAQMLQGQATPPPLVFSSTCAVYGNPLAIPVSEAESIKPISPYGESKAVVEQMLKSCHASQRLNYIALRYFNAAGADPDAEIGEWHEPEPHLIPRVLDVALGRSDSITVNGDDWPTPDGSCVRDYVHVCDLADAHVLALEHLRNGGASGAYNLSAEIGFSVREVIQAAEAVCGRKLSVNVGARRAGDPARIVGSAQRAKADLGWVAKRSSITQIIEDAWRWHLKRAAA